MDQAFNNSFNKNMIWVSLIEFWQKAEHCVNTAYSARVQENTDQ